MYLYADDWAAWERVTADVRAVVDLFGPMPVRYLPTLASSEALLERLEFADGDALPRAAVHADAWSVRAVAILRQFREDPLRSLGDCLHAAFDDPDQRVRGIAWCAVVESLANCEMRARAEEIVSHEFLKRLDEGESPERRQSQAHTFCLLVRSTVLRAHIEQFLGELHESFVEMNGASDAAAIKSSLASAAGFLSHYDVGRRLAALRVVASARIAASAHAAKIAEMIKSDPDGDVRLAAIIAYGELFQGSGNSISRRTLARLVADGNLPVRDRVAAYHSLLRVCGIRKAQQTNSPQSTGCDADAAGDELAAIDWALVETYCGQEDGAGN